MNHQRVLAVVVMAICANQSAAQTEHARVRFEGHGAFDPPGLFFDEVYGSLSASLSGSRNLSLGSQSVYVYATGVQSTEVFNLGIYASIFHASGLAGSSSLEADAFWFDTIRTYSSDLSLSPSILRLNYEVSGQFVVEHNGQETIAGIAIGGALAAVGGSGNVFYPPTSSGFDSFSYTTNSQNNRFNFVGRNHMDIPIGYDAAGNGTGQWGLGFRANVSQSGNMGFVEVRGQDTVFLTSVTLTDGTPLEDIGISYSFDSQTSVPEPGSFTLGTLSALLTIAICRNRYNRRTFC